jgi:hypothetical protein
VWGDLNDEIGVECCGDPLEQGNRGDYAACFQAREGRLGHCGAGGARANVTLYQVSITQVLGDSGTAIEHATTLSPAAIPTAERRGLYWIDVARAYHQWNKPAPCYRALLAAERCAPGEVRYRPPVYGMTEDLLRADQSLPGLRAFARRIGVPAA